MKKYDLQIITQITKAETRDVNGQPVFTVTLPANFSERKGDEWEENVHWYDVTFWNDKAAEAAGKYNVGDLVVATGRPEARAFQRNDGTLGVGYTLKAAHIEVIRRAKNGNGQAPVGDVQDLEVQAAAINGAPGLDIQF